MKRIYLLIVAMAGSFALVGTAEAYGHGGGGGGHFSGGGHYSGGGARYSGGGARYSGGARYYGAPRGYYAGRYGTGTSMPAYRNNAGFTATALRNPTYASGARRFSGNRTAAYNSPTYSRSTARLGAGTRTVANRNQAFNNGRVIGRYSASTWHANWSHGHDHIWHGHHCHFSNGFWFIYDPWPFYGYGYGLYPYDYYYGDGYYDSGAYDQGAYPQEQVYSSNGETNHSDYAVDSQVSNVQSALANAGYYNGVVDGKLGPATRTAIRRYQRDHRLQATGDIDQAVIDALRLR